MLYLADAKGMSLKVPVQDMIQNNSALQLQLKTSQSQVLLGSTPRRTWPHFIHRGTLLRAKEWHHCAKQQLWPVPYNRAQARPRD